MAVTALGEFERQRERADALSAISAIGALTADRGAFSQPNTAGRRQAAPPKPPKSRKRPFKPLFRVDLYRDTTRPPFFDSRAICGQMRGISGGGYDPKSPESGKIGQNRATRRAFRGRRTHRSPKESPTSPRRTGTWGPGGVDGRRRAERPLAASWVVASCMLGARRAGRDRRANVWRGIGLCQARRLTRAVRGD